MLVIVIVACAVVAGIFVCLICPVTVAGLVSLLHVAQLAARGRRSLLSGHICVHL